MHQIRRAFVVLVATVFALTVTTHEGRAVVGGVVAAPFLAGGDLSGSASSQTVVGFQNRPVLSTAPSNGQAYAWNGAAWAPTTIAATHDTLGNSATHVWNFSEAAAPFGDSGTGTQFSLSQIAAITPGAAGIFNLAVNTSVGLNGGSGGCMTGGASGAAYQPQAPLTIGAWVSHDPATGDALVIGRSDDNTHSGGGNNSFSLWDNAGTFEILAKVVTTGFVTVSTAYPNSQQIGVWQLVIATYDATNFKLYVNGDLVKTHAETHNIVYNASNSWTVGGDAASGDVACNSGGGSTGYMGKVTKAFIDETAWTYAKVQSTYQAGVNHSP